MQHADLRLFIGKEDDLVDESYQLSQSVPVFRYRIRTDRDGIPARSAPGRDDSVHSHVHTNSLGPDHDAGRDARWLCKDRLGRPGPASRRAALVVAGTRGAAGCDERGVWPGLEHRGSAMRPAGWVHVDRTGLECGHRARNLVRACAGRGDRVPWLSIATADAAGDNPGAAAERPAACDLALPADAVDAGVSHPRQLAHRWADHPADADHRRGVLRLLAAGQQKRLAIHAGTRYHQYGFLVLRAV